MFHREKIRSSDQTNSEYKFLNSLAALAPNHGRGNEAVVGYGIPYTSSGRQQESRS